MRIPLARAKEKRAIENGGEELDRGLDPFSRDLAYVRKVVHVLAFAKSVDWVLHSVVSTACNHEWALWEELKPEFSCLSIFEIV